MTALLSSLTFALAAQLPFNTHPEPPPYAKQQLALHYARELRRMAETLPPGVSATALGRVRFVGHVLRAGDVTISFDGPDHRVSRIVDAAFGNWTEEDFSPRGTVLSNDQLARIAHRMASRFAPEGYKVSHVEPQRGSLSHTFFRYWLVLKADPEVDADEIRAFYRGTGLDLDPATGGARRFSFSRPLPAVQPQYLKGRMSRARAERLIKAEFKKRWPEIDPRDMGWGLVYHQPNPDAVRPLPSHQRFLSPKYRQYIRDQHPRVVVSGSAEPSATQSMGVLLDGVTGELLVVSEFRSGLSSCRRPR